MKYNRSIPHEKRIYKIIADHFSCHLHIFLTTVKATSSLGKCSSFPQIFRSERQKGQCPFTLKLYAVAFSGSSLLQPSLKQFSPIETI